MITPDTVLSECFVDYSILLLFTTASHKLPLLTWKKQLTFELAHTRVIKYDWVPAAVQYRSLSKILSLYWPAQQVINWCVCVGRESGE